MPMTMNAKTNVAMPRSGKTFAKAQPDWTPEPEFEMTSHKFAELKRKQAKVVPTLHVHNPAGTPFMSKIRLPTVLMNGLDRSVYDVLPGRLYNLSLTQLGSGDSLEALYFSKTLGQGEALLYKPFGEELASLGAGPQELTLENQMKHGLKFEVSSIRVVRKECECKVSNRAHLIDQLRRDTQALALNFAERLQAEAEKAKELESLASMTNLIAIYQKQGMLSEAARLAKEALAIQKRVLGESHPDTLTSMNNLALVYQDQDRLEESADLQEEVLEVMKRELGADHRDTLVSMSNLALVYDNMGKLDEAAELLQEAVLIMKDVQKADDVHTLLAMGNLATIYQKQGKLDEAVELYRNTLKVQEKALGANHSDTLCSMWNLAMAYESQGNAKDAAALYKDCFERRALVLGPDHPETLAAKEAFEDVSA